MVLHSCVCVSCAPTPLDTKMQVCKFMARASLKFATLHPVQALQVGTSGKFASLQVLSDTILMVSGKVAALHGGQDPPWARYRDQVCPREGQSFDSGGARAFRWRNPEQHRQGLPWREFPVRNSSAPRFPSPHKMFFLKMFCLFTKQHRLKQLFLTYNFSSFASGEFGR